MKLGYVSYSVILVKFGICCSDIGFGIGSLVCMDVHIMFSGNFVKVGVVGTLRGSSCAMSIANPLKKLVSCVILDLDGTLLNTGRGFATCIVKV